METGKRGYLLNHDDSFLEPYNMGRSNFEDDFRAAQRQNTLNGVTLIDTGSFDELQSRYEGISKLFQNQISSARDGVTDPKKLQLKEGKTRVDSARQTLKKLQDRAFERRTASRDKTTAAARKEEALSLGLGALALLTGIISLLYVRRGVISPMRKLRDRALATTGLLRIQSIDFDLHLAVEETAALLAERAHSRDLELATLIEYDVPSALRGDPGRIRQVLTNLIGNAIKFTEKGEVVIRVELAGRRGIPCACGSLSRIPV